MQLDPLHVRDILSEHLAHLIVVVHTIMDVNTIYSFPNPKDAWKWLAEQAGDSPIDFRHGKTIKFHREGYVVRVHVAEVDLQSMREHYFKNK